MSLHPPIPDLTAGSIGFRRAATILLGAVTLVAALVYPAPPAEATTRNGRCEVGEFCLYWESEHRGSLVDLKWTIRNYGTGSGCVRFVSSGGGQGQCVKNNSESVWNRTNKPYFVFFNSDFGGRYDKIPSGAKVNLLNHVRNDNASHIRGNAALRFPLNVTQAHIKNRSPSWCYWARTNCHGSYNAADIFVAPGKPVVSPVHGTVMTVNRDQDNRVDSGATVTIKDKWGRLWYLAHMRSNWAVSVGDRVSKGDRVGTSGDRSDALGTAPHLHIDMKVGRNSRENCDRSTPCRGFEDIQALLRSAFHKRPTG